MRQVEVWGEGLRVHFDVMNFSVYILYSQKDKKLYTGCTNNIDRRVREHNSGKIFSTKHRRPLVLIYKQEFEDKGKAFNRERFLKSLWGSRMKQKILKTWLSENNQ